MEKVDVSVLGCCVSREMFNYTDKFKVVSAVYSSFISLFEKKIAVSYDRCCRVVSPQFEARNAYLELNKKVFEYLQENKADYLILDFAEVINEFYLLEDNFIEEDNTDIKIVATPFIKEILADMNIKMVRASSSSCNIQLIVRKLFEQLYLLYPQDHIILNRTTLCKYYIDESGEIRPFQDHYRLKNANVKKVYDFEQEAAKYVCTSNILQPISCALSNGNHKYGCSPVHYTDEDYYYMAYRIENKFDLITEEKLYNSYCDLYQKTKKFS